ncbi:MAG: T9SS type A sorting domain-containing protein, partial [bacterium]
TVSWSYHSNTSVELEILTGNILKIQKPVSFWVGKDSVYVVGTNLTGIRDSCLISFRSIAIPSACGKVPIQLFLLDTLANDSVQWSSVPYDPSISNPKVYNPVVAPEVTTLYRVLAINPSGNIYRDSVLVPRYPSPQPGLGNDTTICLGKSILLSAIGGIRYLWSTGDTTSSITVRPLVKTKYSVTVTNENNCTGTDSILVSVVMGPTVTLEGVLPSYCKNDSPVTLSGRPFGGTYYGTSGLIGDTFYPLLADTGPNILMYFYTDQQTGCTDTALQNVQVLIVPVVQTLPDTSLCANYKITLHAGYGFDNYLWSNGSTDSTIVVDSAGYGLGSHSFWVHVTKDGCVDRDTAVIHFIICPIGMEDNNLSDFLEIFPNPVSGKVQVVLKSAVSGKVKMQIFGTKGEEIGGRYDFTCIRNEVDLSSFPTGVYLLKIEVQQRVFHFKLIRQ